MIRLAAALLAFTCISGAAQAAGAGFKNLNLEQAGPDGLPLGWHVIEMGVKVTRECTPGCALRFTGVRGSQGALVQQTLNVDAGAAGRRVVLSGRLRSERFAGTVLPQVAAIVNGRPAVSDYPDARATRGTTDWRDFTVSQPIVPGTSQLAIGVSAAGEGSVWFDRLAVRFDDGAPVVAQELTLPPRPAPSQALLDDDALRLAPAAIPAVSEAWRADVRARRQPIRSLFSDDFSDLQFLKPLLEGKRVVQLGESSHGVAEFNWMKVRLIKFLHQELGYEVVAFESSLPQCFDADGMVGKLEARELLRHCIFSIWDSAEVAPLFDYIKDQRAAGKRLALAGFDTQFTAFRQLDKGERLQSMLAAVGFARADDAPAVFTQLQANPGQAGQYVQAWMEEARAALERSRNRLTNTGFTRPAIEVQIQSLRSWQHLIRQTAAPRTGPASDNLRDVGMADNLNFLLDTLYPGRKVIVWAHNAHIAYDKAPDKFTSMGMHLARQRKDELYTIGLYMGRGVAAQNDGSHHAIAPPSAGSLEAVLANGGWKYAFVDLARGEKSWPDLPVNSRYMGLMPEVFTPARAYDGLIYIDTVTPPDKR